MALITLSGQNFEGGDEGQRDKGIRDKGRDKEQGLRETRMSKGVIREWLEGMTWP